MAVCILIVVPAILLAQATPATNAPRPFGRTLSPREKAKAEAEKRITNAPPRLPAGTELIGPHLGGEVVTPLPNYWDGVDDRGNLRVNVAADPVLNDVGVFGNTLFPPSVNVADMNEDKLPDLVVADRYGFLWIFFNSGQKGKPKFTTGTLIPTFLGVSARINVADWDGDMDNDIVFGTFYGDFQVLPNIGTAKQPKFTTSMGLPRFCADPSIGLPQVLLDRKPFVPAIYTAPWVMDWNNDGKVDLIFGEGTYSANSVRIAFNSGSAARPVFKEDNVFFLAYGSGYEQLVPSVVDYNGDGIPDVMCGTRTGEIRLFKNTGRSVAAAQTYRGIKEPAALDVDRNLPIENLELIERMTAPFPYDWNEDGMFDIIMGSTNGTIMVALNEGTLSEPLFRRIKTLEGTNTNPDLVGPVDWAGTVGRDYHCNSAGYLSSEEAIVLETGMPPVVNPADKNQAPQGNVIRPVEGKRFLYYRYMREYPGWTAYPGYWRHSDHEVSAYYLGGVLSRSWVPASRGLSTGKVGKMSIGRSYVFSFSYILTGRNSATWRLSSTEGFTKYNDEFDDYDSWGEGRSIPGSRPLSPTARGWQKVTVNFTCPGVQKGQALTFPMVAVPGVGVAQEMTFSIHFALPENDCELLLDNFSLKETGVGPPM